MQIKSLMFCNSVQQLTAPDGKTVTAIFDPTAMLALQYIPGVYSLCVAFCLTDIAAGASYNVSFSFTDPCGNVVSNGSMTITVPGDCPDVAATAWIDLRNVSIKTEGTYSLQINYGDSSVSETVELRKVAER